MASCSRPRGQAGALGSRGTFAALAILCLAALAAPQARAVTTLNVSGGQWEEHRIAVVPFAYAPGMLPLPQNPAAVVASDLGRFGPFWVLPNGRMMSLPSKREQVVPSEWLSLGVEYVLVGEVRQGEMGLVSVHWQLLDLVRGGLLHSGTLRDDGAGVRQLGHRLAARAQRLVSGTSGPYLSQLVYVWEDLEGPPERRYSLILTECDGTVLRELHSSPDPILSPTWSPDGRLLAFSKFTLHGTAVFLLDLGSGEVTTVGSWTDPTSAPSFSPSGRRLALSISREKNRDIYIYDLKARTLTRITRHYAIETEPHWSAGGDRLLFTSDRAGGPQLYTFNFLSGEVQRVTWEGEYNARGSFIDDDRVLHVHASEKGRELAVTTLSSGGLKRLGVLDENESPALSPDRSVVTYARRYADGYRLAVYLPDWDRGFELQGLAGANKENTKGVLRDPSWSPPLG